MHEQLFLLRSDDRPWRLDEHTREVGRQGIRDARAALREATAETARTGDRRVRRQTAA